MDFREMLRPILLGLIATGVVLFLMTRGKRIMMRTCIILFVLAFAGGFILYTIGYLPRGAIFADVLEAMLRGLFSTGRMFLINDDYGFLLDTPDAQWLVTAHWFQIVFWLSHVMALVVSISALCGLFGRKLIDRMRMRTRRFRRGVYLIFGNDKRALALGENLATHDGRFGKMSRQEADGVEPLQANSSTPAGSAAPSKQTSSLLRQWFARLVQGREPDAVTDPKRLVVFLDEEFSDEMRESISQFGGVALEYDDHTLRSQLRRAGLGSHLRAPVCKVIILAQDEAKAMSLASDVLEYAHVLDKPRMVYLEKQLQKWDARQKKRSSAYTGKEERRKVAEPTHRPERRAGNRLARLQARQVAIYARLNLYVQSESGWLERRAEEIATEYGYSLYTFNEAELAARQLVKMQPPSLNIRFDKNGVSSGPAPNLTVMILGFGQTGTQALRRLIMNGQFLGSRMRAIVVDKDIEDCRGRFEYNYPGFKECCDIEYHSLQVRSTAFYQLAKSLQGQLHYIVLALNDDVHGMETAQTLITMYSNTPAPAPGVKPLIPLMAIAVSDNDRPGKLTGNGVLFFSQRSDICSESVLIREDADRMAIAVNYAYASEGKTKEVGNKLALWLALPNFKRESNRASADFIPSILHMTGTKRSELRGKSSMALPRDLQDNVAKTEHLRWNAFHYGMGYVSMSVDTFAERVQKGIARAREDTVARQHFCLVDWDSLVLREKISDKLLGVNETKYCIYDYLITDYAPMILDEAGE